jgi:hypothetical protein
MTQWPLKVLLVHPEAKFLKENKFTIAADCSVLVHKGIVEKFGKEAVIIGCPMLEDPKRFFEKIKLIFEKSKAEKIEVYSMEVPCCHAIHMMVDKALRGDAKVEKFIVRISGNVESYTGFIDRSMIEAEAKAHEGLACRR